MHDDFRRDFDLPRGRVWLNSAHQGVMPRAAVEAARETLRSAGVEVAFRQGAFRQGAFRQGAFRQGAVRVAPHLYNTDEDIERTLSVLNAL